MFTPTLDNGFFNYQSRCIYFKGNNNQPIGKLQ